MLLGLNALAQSVGDKIKVGSATYEVVGSNLFINGSFDDGVDGWKTIDYTTDAVLSNFVWSETGGWDDGAYLTTNAAGAGAATTIRQSVAVESGKTYYFCVYTSGKAPAANNFNYNALFKMKDFKTEDGVLKAFEWPQGANTETTDWNKTEFVFTADEAHPYAGVRMGWNASTKFDNFVICEVVEAGLDLTDLNNEIAKAQEQLAGYEAGTEWHTLLAEAIAVAQAAKPETVAELTETVDNLKAAEKEAQTMYMKTLYAKFDSDEYYFKNVVAERFFGAGNSWGTQLSLIEGAEFVEMTALEDGRYELNMHVANGARTRVGLSGGAANIFCDAAEPGSDAAALCIYPAAEEGKYLLTFDNENYLCAPAEGNVVAITTDKEDENALWEIVNFAKMQEMINNMQEGDEPIEITGLIKCPNFHRNNNNNDGWTKTGGGYKNSGAMTNFNYESWNNTFEMYQVLNVPSGMYRLEMQGFYRYGTGADADVARFEGTEELKATLYANDDEVQLWSIFEWAPYSPNTGSYKDADNKDAEFGFKTMGVKTGQYYPASQGDASHAFIEGNYVNTIDEITVTGNELKIGVRKLEKYANDWTVMDNFRLWYLGPVANINYLALQKALEKLNDVRYDKCSAATADAAAELAEDIQNNIEDYTEDQCHAKLQEVNDMMAKIAEEKVAYVSLDSLCKVNDIYVEMYKDHSSIATMLNEKKEILDGDYENGSATIEDIQSHIEKYIPQLKQAVKAVYNASVESPLNVSILFDNMKADSTALWTSTASAFKANFNNWEVYQQTFDVNRKFTELVKGSYTIKSKALMRFGSTAETITAGESDITSFMYADGVSARFNNMSEAIEFDNPQVGTFVECDGGFMPNDQKAIRYSFDTNTACGIELNKNVFEENGSIIIGFRNEADYVQPGSWSVWSDLELIYNGEKSDDIYNEFVATKKITEDMMDEYGDFLTDEGYTGLLTIVEKASGYTSSTDKDKLIEAITEMNKWIQYNKETMPLREKILAAYQKYSDEKEKYTQKDFSERNLEVVLFEINQKYTGEGDLFASNAEIEKYMNMLPELRVRWIIGEEYKSATEENPYDMTLLVENPDFENDGNGVEAISGWVNDGSQKLKTQNNTSFTLKNNEYYIERWHAAGTVNVRQTIVGLPEGFYTLTAAIKSEVISDGALFADETELVVESATEDSDHSVTFEVKAGAKETTIGFKCEMTDGGSSWVALDNFRLEYLGTAPTGIESIDKDAVVNPIVNGVYNLSGQSVGTLRKGINIVGGKKVMVK